MTGKRSLKVSRLLPLAVAALLVGLLAFGAISAAARDGEETTTPTTPAETPVVEVPVVPPVIQTPPTVEVEKPVEVQLGNEKTTAKPTTQPAPQSEATTGTGTGGSQSSGTNTGSSTTTTTPSTTTPSRGGTRAAHATSGHHSSGGNSASDESQSGAKSTGGGNTESHANAPSAPLPTHAPTKVAAHVEHVLGKKLPSHQLEEAGTALAKHLGLVSKHPGVSQHAAVTKIGQALGTALVGSAVAVDRQPPPTKPSGPIAIFRAPGEHAISFLLIVALAILTVFGSFLYVQFRAIRHGALPLQIRVFGRQWEPARTAIRIETAMQGPRNVLERCVVAMRRVGSAATSGLRSFF